MMPFSKENNRRIYIAALVISFLLIVGSIYLHLRQKTHLGRISYTLDRERVKPTSGVEATTWLDENDSQLLNETNERSSSEEVKNDDSQIRANTSPMADDVTMLYANLRDTESSGVISEGIDEQLNENTDGHLDESAEEIDQSSENAVQTLQQGSSACLRCLCMTVNECRPTFCGSGNPCGLYRISKKYWIDGGKPTIAGGSTDNEDQDYLTCVNEDTCSTTVIRQYYNRYKRDCNKDGISDCTDQIALHLLGPSGCLTDNLSFVHARRMKNCLIESDLKYFSYSSDEEFSYYLT